MPSKKDTKEFIRDRLNGSDYDRGQLEEAQAQARNATNGLARLIQLLETKGILNDEDIEHIGDARYDY